MCLQDDIMDEHATDTVRRWMRFVMEGVASMLQTLLDIG